MRTLERDFPGALRAADAVGFHPYHHNTAGIKARVHSLRQLLVESGAAAVPIEITEFGAPAAEVSITKWGSDLTETVRDLATSTCGISRVITYRDQDPHTGTGIIDRFGHYVMYDKAGNETSLAGILRRHIAGEAGERTLRPLSHPTGGAHLA